MNDSPPDRINFPQITLLLIAAGLVIIGLALVFPGGLGFPISMSIMVGLLLVVVAVKQWLPRSPSRGRRLKPAGMILLVGVGMGGPIASFVVGQLVRDLGVPLDPLLASAGVMLMVVGTGFLLVDRCSNRLLEPLPDECVACGYPSPSEGRVCPECGLVRE